MLKRLKIFVFRNKKLSIYAVCVNFFEILFQPKKGKGKSLQFTYSGRQSTRSGTRVYDCQINMRKKRFFKEVYTNFISLS